MSVIEPQVALDPRTPPIELLPLVGPDAALGGREPCTYDQAITYCRGLANSHYENFSVLTSLVPAKLRDDFAAVYAFCRWADDLGDETGHTPEARARSEQLLNWWRAELNKCFSARDTGILPVKTHVLTETVGDSGVEGQHEPNAQAESPCHIQHPVFIALRETARKHPHLTAKPFNDLIDAFVQDQRVGMEGNRYQTWDQVVDYCTRSANPVGRIVLVLGGYAPSEVDPANSDRYAMSDATCTALQLINFWQDVRRDLLERDRVYIPEETGITAAMLRDWADRPNDPAARVPFIRALRPLVDRTAELFALGRPLPKALEGGKGGERGLAPVVWLFGAGGETILSAVRHIGCATLWERPRLRKSDKVLLIARAWMRSTFRAGK